MKISDINVEVRDINLNRVGSIPPESLDITANTVYSNVGSWTLNLPPEHPMAPVLRAPGSGIICTGPTDVLFSGPMIGATYSADTNNPSGMLEIGGVTDEIVLADRIAMPDPANDPLHQTLAHDTITGSAEGVMYHYVDVNCGPGARAERREFGLTLGANLRRGATITKSARFEQLGSYLTDIALAAGLGFRVVQRGSNLVFEVYAVTDRTKTIRLDLWNNTLASQKVALTAPTATQVIVGGQGDLTQRQFYLGNNATSLAAETTWRRRIERFLDQRQTDDPNEFASAANEVLAAEGDTIIAATVETLDDATMAFGRDWFLGDKVAAVADNGEYASMATQMVLKADSQGFRVGVGLGDLSKLDDDRAALQRIIETSLRVDALERKQ